MKNIIVIACCRSGHNFVMDQIQSWGEFNTINFEDMLPQKYINQHEMYCRSYLIDPTRDTNRIVVVRDLLNWWASYLTWITKTACSDERKLNYAFRIWTEQVQEAFDITHNIPGAIDVNYDMFKTDPDIRKGLCFVLGGDYSEKRIDKIPEAGNGSSFDKDIPGSQMQTGLRYQQICNTPLRVQYLDMLSQHPEAMQLYKTHFKLTAEQKELCKLITH